MVDIDKHRGAVSKYDFSLSCKTAVMYSVSFRSITKASFYTQMDAESKPIGYELVNRWNSYEKGGATSTEMESSALFIIGETLRIRVATVLVSATDYKNYSNDSTKNGPERWEHRAIEVGIEAMRRIIQDDKARQMAN